MSMPSEADVQPQFDWNASTVYNCLYFIIFMVVAHGTVQLFVGVSRNVRLPMIPLQAVY